MVNQSKKNEPRAWKKWRHNGAIGNVNGRDFGEAYAFFNCNAPLEQIAEEFITIRGLVNTPKRLEINLAEGILPFFDDSELLEIAREAKDAGIRYLMSVKPISTLSNEEVADELSSILNQAYCWSPLYQEGESFVGEVAYKNSKGRYQFRE